MVLRTAKPDMYAPPWLAIAEIRTVADLSAQNVQSMPLGSIQG